MWSAFLLLHFLMLPLYCVSMASGTKDAADTLRPPAGRERTKEKNQQSDSRGTGVLSTKSAENSTQKSQENSTSLVVEHAGSEGSHGDARSDSVSGSAAAMGALPVSGALTTGLGRDLGMEMGSLASSVGQSGPEPGHLLTPVQLASLLRSVESPDLTGVSSGDTQLEGPQRNSKGFQAQKIFPAVPVMNSWGEDLKDIDHRNRTDGDNRSNSSFATDNLDTDPAVNGSGPNFVVTDTSGVSASIQQAMPTNGSEFFRWWPTEEPCGPACLTSGGRCVYDFNQTYSQVCIYDSLIPCENLLCEHGTCVTLNGSHTCKCHEHWSGTFCNKPCDLDCGLHGDCVVIEDQIRCKCQKNYTGDHCDDLLLMPFMWTGDDDSGDALTVWQIAAGCLGAVGGLLTCLMLVAYVTWRKQWLPMRKIVHYFQQCEEDDGKEYDAFISYRSCSRDEEFVLQELYPQLERHLDFKLCMHFRDFPPGETIANNIIQAIENSRRTILVLSPAYVQSEWCRLEYQKAQHEMLKLRHKIIPVMLEDVSHVQPVDRNLQTILDTVTYIQWPGSENSKGLDRFWKLLQLSMPKRKSDYSRSLSSTGSCASDRPLTAVSSSCFDRVVNSMTDNELQPQRSLSITSSLEESEEVSQQMSYNDSDQYSVSAEEQSKSSNVSYGDKKYDGDVRDRSSSGSDKSGDDDKLASRDSRAHHKMNHVTSDDHIVEIREFPGNKIKITPWVPARFSTKF